MEMTKMDDDDHTRVKPQNADLTTATQSMVSETHQHHPTKLSAIEQEATKNSTQVELHAKLNPEGGAIISKEAERASQVTQRMSRAETVRQDARKLKTATLNRMGKMFKQRSQTPVADKSFLGVDDGAAVAKSMENCGQEPLRKDKSNSLGRMLKLVDKDGTPKKLFYSRAGSLSRILRRHPHNESNDDKKTAEENSPGIFSKMLNQLRGRPHSGNASIEPNIRTREKMSSLPPKLPSKSRPANLSSSASASASPPPATGSSQKSANDEHFV